MKKGKNVSMVILIILMISGSSVNAQKGNRYAEGDMDYKYQAHYHGMENAIPDLTDKQKEEIKVLRISHMKEAQQLRNQMGIKRAELKALQINDKIDIDAINKKIEEKATLRTELEKKDVGFRQAVRSLLTDEQKLIFDERTNHYHEGLRGNFGHNGNGNGNRNGNGNGNGTGNGIGQGNGNARGYGTSNK